jgi:ubiquinone/menaquinone biosynthesis C-methylase UbiE
VGKQGWSKSGHFTFTSEYPALRRWLVAQLPQKRTILTVGCGTGELEKILKQRGHQVVGLDLSYDMLKTTGKRGLDRLVQADAHMLPFASAYFDVVILPETLGYVDPDLAFQQAIKVLKKDGHFLITSYPLHLSAHAFYKKVSASDISCSLARVGFSVDDRRFLIVRRTVVREAKTEGKCSLLFILARKGAC